MRENIVKKDLENAENAASLSKIKVRRPKDSKGTSSKKAKSGDITDRLQALAEELEASKPAAAPAEPVFEESAADLFEAPSNKAPINSSKKKRKKQEPVQAKSTPTAEPSIAPEKKTSPEPSAQPTETVQAKVSIPEKAKKEILPRPLDEPIAELEKPEPIPAKTVETEAESSPAVSAVPPRRANWARPASAPGWQKKTQTPDILSYWMEIRNGNRYPTWQNLDTQKIGKFWPNCVLVHGNRSSGRLQLETSFSNELRQSAKRANPLRDFTMDIDFSPMVVDWVLSLARDVANTGKPAHGTEYFPSVFDEIPLRVIALPLSENQIDVDHVLCYVQKLS
jgi:hypothetical protein